MKKAIRAAVLSCVPEALFAGITQFAQRVRDWHDLDKCHDHVQEAVHAMENARAPHHCYYDMAGHGARAEERLHGQQNTNYTKRSRRPGRSKCTFQSVGISMQPVRWPSTDGCFDRKLFITN